MPKSNMNTTLNYSPNFYLKKRKLKEIKFIIFHYTGMKKENQAIAHLTNNKSKVSSHYFIKNNGEIISLVPDLYVAWHAGKSNWNKHTSLNSESIGIEISNPGHEHGYRKFSDRQIKSLIRISKLIINKYKIDKKKILGHSDIAPLRKKDPGEKFPWKLLSKQKIGIWHKVNLNILKSLRGKKSELNLDKFIIYLKRLGYNMKYSNLNELKKIIKIFQMRFRPEIIDGKLDAECYIIAKSLYNLR